MLVMTTLSVSLTALFVGAASGAPVDNLRAKAKVLATQIDENGVHIAALGEQLNAAQLKLDEAQAKIGDAETRIAAAKAEASRLTALVQARAVSIYHRGGVESLPEFDVASVSDANVRKKYAAVTADRENGLLDQLAQARVDLATERANAQNVRDSAQQEKDALASAKAEADAAAGAQQVLLGQVNGQIADLVRQEQVQRAVAQSAAPPAANQKQRWTGPVPNPSGGAGAAVAFAQAQVGKPYEYAATGPDTFDCSGLTMRAWQAGGLSLPHYSGAQAAMFPRVPLDQLRPGDLITTSSWSAHIGIWTGSGYVHATHTGDFVRYVPGSGSVRDAVRPG